MNMLSMEPSPPNMALHEPHFIPSPASTALLFLLPPCLVLLVIDMAIRSSHRLQTTTTDEDRPPITIDPLSNLASRAQRVLSSFRELERQYSHNLALEKRRCRTLSPQPGEYKTMQIQSNRIICEGNKPVSKAFTVFCERLLLTNRILKQEREIKALKKARDSSKAAHCSGAFKALCDNLLLSNSLWKKQREIDELQAECEQMKRSRIGVVTRAAKQMVLDVQKERLIEEFVKDLIAEGAETKRSMAELRLAHEREIADMAGEWRREYGMLRREVGRLWLAREASLIEQDISNQLEERLHEQLSFGRDSVATSHDVELEEGYGSDDADTLFGADADDMSNTSTSTCVSPGFLSPTKASHYQRRPITRLPLSKLLAGEASPSKPVTRRVDTRPFAGFSFNPLFFDCGEASPREGKTACVEAPPCTPLQPVDERKRLSQQKSMTPSAASPSPRVRDDAVRSLQPSTKVAWRV